MGAAAVLDALGEGTRRDVLEALRGGPSPVGVIAAGLPVSRPAVSKHLRVLEGAGLVTCARQGTRSGYSIDARGLDCLRQYLDDMWTDALSAFVAFAESEPTQ